MLKLIRIRIMVNLGLIKIWSLRMQLFLMIALFLKLLSKKNLISSQWKKILINNEVQIIF